MQKSDKDQKESKSADDKLGVNTTTNQNNTSKSEEKPEVDAAGLDSVAIPKEQIAVNAQNTIKSHVIAAMAFGLVPVPLLDLGLLVGTQVKLVQSLSRLYDVPFKENRVKSIVISLISSSVPVAGTIGLSTGAKLIPGIGSLVGNAIVSTTGGAITYAVGRVFVNHFESGGTLLDFSTKKMRGLFKKELDNGHEVAKEYDTDPEAVAS